MEIVYSLIVIATFVALIVGLINPSLIMRWSKKPSRLKVITWWFLANFILGLLMTMSVPEPSSQELINSAKRNIAEENYSSALYDLRRIEQSDSLYSEALVLISEADSLLALQKENRSKSGNRDLSNLQKKSEEECLYADSILQVLKKRMETEITKLNVQYDDFEGRTWLYSKRKPYYSNSLGFYTYIGINDNGQFWRRLVIRYHGDEWLFLKSIVVKTDDFVYQFDASDAKRDNNADVWEWIDIPVQSYESLMLKAVIDSKQTKIRFNGYQYHYDWTLSSDVIKGLEEIDNYYYLLDSVQKFSNL